MGKKKEKATLLAAPAPAEDEVSYLDAWNTLYNDNDGAALAALVDPQRSNSQNNQWMLRNERGNLLARVGYDGGGELAVLQD